MTVLFNTLNVIIPICLVAAHGALGYLIWLIVKKRNCVNCVIALFVAVSLVVISSVLQSELQKQMIRDEFAKGLGNNFENEINDILDNWD